MSDSCFFSVEYFPALAIVTYTRPPINMMSFEALGELEDLLLALSRDLSLCAVVLTGGIPGYFCAHADVADVMRMECGKPPLGDPDAWDRVNELLGQMPQLTVAAVNGQAWGGGCELALACDLILLSQAGHLRMLEVSKGVIPGAGGTQRLPRRIGIPRALTMLLTSQVIHTEEALRWGLADAVLPELHFMDEVRGWLSPILSQPVHAVHAAKLSVCRGSALPLDEGLALEKSLFSQLVSCNETRDLGEKTVETL